MRLQCILFTLQSSAIATQREAIVTKVLGWNTRNSMHAIVGLKTCSNINSTATRSFLSSSWGRTLQPTPVEQELYERNAKKKDASLLQQFLAPVMLCLLTSPVSKAVSTNVWKIKVNLATTCRLLLLYNSLPPSELHDCFWQCKESSHVKAPNLQRFTFQATNSTEILRWALRNAVTRAHGFATASAR